jgi:hypothetical protein
VLVGVDGEIVEVIDDLVLILELVEFIEGVRDGNLDGLLIRVAGLSFRHGAVQLAL